MSKRHGLSHLFMFLKNLADGINFLKYCTRVLGKTLRVLIKILKPQGLSLKIGFLYNYLHMKVAYKFFIFTSSRKMKYIFFDYLVVFNKLCSF